MNDATKIAFEELYRARGIISASRHLIAVEEKRIKDYLIVVRSARMKLRVLVPHGDTEEICRGIK
jgi:hypothetical protein